MLFLYTFGLMILILCFVGVFIGGAVGLMFAIDEFNLPVWLIPIALMIWIALAGATLVTLSDHYKHITIERVSQERARH